MNEKIIFFVVSLLFLYNYIFLLMCNVSECFKKVTSFTENVRHRNFFPNWAHSICNLQTSTFLNKIMIATHILGASVVA